MIQVYKLSRDTPNIYRFVEEITFETLPDARDYIIRKTMPWIVCFECPPTEKYCRQFCFGNIPTYFDYVGYYLTPLPMTYIQYQVDIRGCELRQLVT
jgi:hypothetical protein